MQKLLALFGRRGVRRGRRVVAGLSMRGQLVKMLKRNLGVISMSAGR